MDSLGDYLKQARETKGISLEQIVLQTRIPEYHLLALEAEDFANLPAKVFAKGFVRSYAKAVGLDEEEAVQRFLQSSGSFYNQYESDHPQPHAQVTLEAPPRQRPNWMLIVGGLAILGIWFGLPDSQDQEEQMTEQTVSSEPEISPSPAIPKEDPILPQASPQPDASSEDSPKPPQESTSVNETIPSPSSPPISVSPVPLSTPELVSEPDPLPSPTLPTDEGTSAEPVAREFHVLEIEATQLTWVVVRSDQKEPNEALLQPGQRISWKAKEEFLLTLGNAAGVMVRLNGEPKGPFGKSGQVVRDIRIQP